MKNVKTLLKASLAIFMLSVTSLASAVVIESVSWNGSNYMLLEINTWQGSETEAQGLGGHLVTVNSQLEHDFLWGLWGFGGSSANTANELWIGINDLAVEGTFVWSSGEVVSYTNWGPGEPNNLGGEDGGHMWSNFVNGQWNDADTSLTFFAIAEVDQRVSSPGALVLFFIGISALTLRRIKKA
jgi:hypothetical protein